MPITWTVLFRNFRLQEKEVVDDLVPAYRRMIASLLDGIVVHAVRGNPADYEHLESDLASLRQDISQDHLGAGDLLMSTGAALKALQDYNRRTQAFNHAQSAELQKITAMLTGAIINLSTAGSTSVSRLQALEKQLEKAAGLEDVRLLKEELAECIIGIREEKMRQQVSCEEVVQELKQNVSAVRSIAVSKGAIASRPAAEQAIALVSDEGLVAYAVLFVIDHLHGLNARFGRAVGDQMITLFSEHLSQSLTPTDYIFRWSGPAFLLLLKRDEPIERIRRSLAPLTNARLEKTIEIRERTVLLPLNFSWTILAVTPGGKAATVVDRLDAFVASKVGNEA